MQDLHRDWLTWLLQIHQVTLSGFAFNLAQPVGWSSNFLLTGYFKVTFTISHICILKDYCTERKTMTSNPEHSRGHFLISAPRDRRYTEEGSLIWFAWESSCNKSNRYKNRQIFQIYFSPAPFIPSSVSSIYTLATVLCVLGIMTINPLFAFYLNLACVKGNFKVTL